ncbi:cytochrome c biogenesis CcdA family protein [Micromonospora sagamiensis]|uniref:Cytochrome c biogenesis protein CcdA n=1 Tax=Micromonospora sagamiensis TaxID=47875 RepID=A0A562WE30_9ACTN|nr:cytochrome c biogenesis CcdA family protein [Micromonospora sagamiensis]TWJ28550.1 cytochrome c biogenesis protein CcdA [Micromonospora sagamiensis]BCL12548.1 cytochrome C biogenesis protein CcdA [Micromonospora sagamiensis]
MPDTPYGLAVGAGLLAAVNPCGFALLPAYLSVLVLGDEPAAERGQFAPIGRAVALTGAMTLGFVAVFGAFGLLAAPVADTVARHLPWASILIGLALVAAGCWLLAGRQLPTFTPKVATGPAVRRRFGSMVLFGMAYAIASLGCTIGPFLAIVAAGFRAGSALSGIGLFVAYAMGMGLAVGAAALAVALARDSLVRRTRRAAPLLGRATGLLLMVTGGYVAWYGWYEVRVLTGRGDADDPVIAAASAVQTALSGWLAGLGPWTVAAAALVLLALAAGVTLTRRHRTPTRQGRRPSN